VISAAFFRAGIVVLLAGALLSDAVAGPPAPDSVLRVAWRDGRLSVTAERVPLTRILEAVAREVGLELVGLDRFDELVSVSFSDLPFEEGLRRLLRDISYVVIDDPREPGDGRLTRILVFGVAGASEGRAEAGTAGLHGGVDVERPLGGSGPDPTQAERLAALRAAAEQGDETLVRQAALDPDESIQATAVELLANRDHSAAMAVLVEASRGGPVTQRLGAIHLLHQTGVRDDETVVRALADALAADDVAVKNYAIQALATRGGSASWAALRRALADPDPSVRLAVVENAAMAEEGWSLVQEALVDADEDVRSLAEFWLKQARPAAR
jgi:hypothetical protein